MRFNYYIIIILLIVQSTFFCQGFNTGKTGIQTFYFKDPENRNQILFTSEALLETFTGMTTDVWGEVSFDPIDIQNTIKGEIFISVNSIKTGLEMRDEALRNSSWLNAEEYPYISFRIKEVEQPMILENNKIKLSLAGLFNCHGKSRDIMLSATLTLLEESVITKKRMPGDLLSVGAKFDINLSDYGIRNMFIPNRVSEKTEIEVNIVGTNSKSE
jgi:polyisoprenoid-binding protein YceI